MTIEQLLVMVALTCVVCIGVYFVERWINNDND